MKVARLPAACLVLGTLTAMPGCFVPRSQLTAVQSQYRVLSEHNRALKAQVNNLEIHSHEIEDRFFRTEEELHLMEEEVGLDREELARFRRERAALHEQVKSLAGGRAPLSPEVRRQLADLSDRYPSLHFDPATGVSKLDTDVLFDSGEAELKPAADRMLQELVRVLRSPELSDLKVMVVGHTDDQQIAKRPAREKYPTNFHLSAARALAVAGMMRRQGFEEHRIGVAGFGPHQPVAPNVSPLDRRKNRRVEIFVMAPDVPVIGWTESTTSLY